ncbi:MAG: hypothetical protein APF77_00570 [Clostridia bacterium BRH_c25]|nr:MAG: hypothetical protein APF77_00570 [Clostridia bacterium BRH_c25]
MKIEFPVGFHSFHKNRLLNFQLNRWYSAGCLNYDELMAATKDIHDFNDWKEVFKGLAQDAMEKGNWVSCATYLRAAEFFALGDDPEKDELYENCMEAYKKAYRDEPIIYEQIPYENAYLPVMRIMSGENSKGWIVMHGGYDSFIQELYPFCKRFNAAGYNVIMFEGPGQGGVLRKYGLKMTHEWERPVRAVLNHYKLSDVTLIGISLGGYLAARAAAFEKRIGRVVLYDIIYDFYKAFISELPLLSRGMIELLLHFEKHPAWRKIEKKSADNMFSHWLISQGYDVFGVNSMPKYLKCQKLYNTKELSKYITQDALMLAGEEDVYTKFYKKQEKALVNARTVTGRIFTKDESASHHCQVGNIGLVLDCIIDWLESRKEEA